MRSRRAVPPSLALGALLAAGLTGQQPGKAEDPRARPRPADANALFALFAASTGLEATFEEDKHLALLALPLRSKGKLWFFRPASSAGYLARHVETPEPSSVLVTPTELRLTNRDGNEVVDLRRSDKVRTFVQSLVHVFAGDQAALAKAYTVDFAAAAAPDARGWTLTLVPRAEPLNRMLESLRLVGEGHAVLRIEVKEPNGDRTVTRIVAADPQRRFDAAEQKRLFGIELR